MTKYAVIATCAAYFSFSPDPASPQVPTSTERVIPSNSSFEVKSDWFNSVRCPSNDGNRFYFQIGTQPFGVPASEFSRGILKRIKATKLSNGEVNAHIPATAGCKSNPLLLVQAAIQKEKNSPNFVVLAETAERTESVAPVMRYIAHLSKTGACQPAKLPDLIVCVGSRTESGQTVRIVFLIASEGGNKVDVPESGIPIHARCESITDAAGSCYVSEELANHVTIKSAIDQKSISASQIRQLRRQLIEFANLRRAK